MSRKDLINLEFFPKLLSLKLARFRDLNHDARMDLIDEGDGSFPDPVNTRKLLLDSHNKAEIKQAEKRICRKKCCCAYEGGDQRKERDGLRRLKG